jgi:hypothetical protein
MLHTTLELCRAKDACPEGFKKLKKSLGKGHSDTELIPLTHVLESNGLLDTLWVLRATVEDSSYVAREFAIFCDRQVLSIYEDAYPDDSRVRDCIDATERYNNKEITLKKLRVFNEAARNAAWAASGAASGAAWAAAAAAWAAAAAAAWAAAASAAAGSTEAAAEKEQSIKLTELLNNHN